MNTKILKIFIGISLCFVLCSCKDNSNNQTNINNNNNKDITITLNNDNILNLCNSSDKCPYHSENVYQIIDINTDVDELKNIVKKINDDTLKYYQKSKDSKLAKDSKCGAFSNDILYSYYVKNDIYTYIDDEIVSIAVQRTEKYICDGKSNSMKPEVYIYSLKENRLLDQNSFKKEYALSNDRISYVINRHMDNLYPDFDANAIKPEDVFVFKDSKWGLVFMFYIKELNSYTLANIPNGEPNKIGE